MAVYSCPYCPERFDSFRETIGHLLESHSSSTLKFRRRQNNTDTVRNYKLIPELCREEGRTITINEETEKIHLSKRNVIPKDSPFKKILKCSTDHGADCAPDGSNTQDYEVLGGPDEPEESVEYEELISLIPSVIDEMKRTGKLDDYMAFHRLVYEGKFPLNNIAYLLFTDVVRWFSLDRSSVMRYSEEVKLFWRTGLRLFHGRFLRFMGGPKSSGQVNDGSAKSGLCCTEESNVNFVVPNRNSLKEEKRFLKESVPGILDEMLTTIAQSNLVDDSKTFKVCVDGKKINPTSQGEINLWGYEDTPTFKQKLERIDNEMTVINKFKDSITKQISFGHSEVKDCDVEARQSIVDACRSIVTLLSARLRDLRQLKVKKDLFLHKLTEKSGTDWRNSHYAMVISSIKTTIYRIENTVDEIITFVDGYCKCAATVGQADVHFSADKIVPLMNQGNLVCLGNSEGDANQPPLIKQRSETWHELRKSCPVTGSTINTAIGLDGLKKQKEFLEEKAGKRTPKEIPPDLQRKFDYGTQNEPNAVATVASKFLPAFHPECLLYEEGCYLIKENEKAILLVSPDGSIRDHTETSIRFGLEIKCPFPGKVYTTEVHYEIPRYYVPQILSEMCALDVETLLFVSYSADSTTVHYASFDDALWNDIMTEIRNIDLKSIPKKLGTELPSLKEKIGQYCKSNVHLVAEIPSCKAELCSHTSTASRIHHEPIRDHGSSSISLGHMERSCMKAATLVRECKNICAQKASEVLVFLVSDLDRLFKPEIPHALPIAYALKGYSMKTDVMRKMINDVLHALFINGMYTPVVSYDGQWAKLAFQTQDGDPLTLLELQKKVYNDVKNKSASELTNYIFQCGVISVRTMEEVETQLDFEKGHSGIYVGLKGGQKLLKTSSHMVALLKGLSGPTTTKTKRPNENHSCIDEVLSDVPADVISTIDDDMIHTLANIEYTDVSPMAVHGVEIVNSEEIESLFTQGTPDESQENVESEISTAVEQDGTSDDSGLNVDAQEIHCTKQMDNEKEMDMIAITTVISHEDLGMIHQALQNSEKWRKKWQGTTLTDFQTMMKTAVTMSARCTKAELLFCVDTYNDLGKGNQIRACKSWNKQRLVATLHEACTSAEMTETRRKQATRKNPSSLKVISRKAVKSYPKKLLNAIVAENEFPEKVELWRMRSPFGVSTHVDGIGDIQWFSVPEYNNDTLAYVFSLLDVHHIITNCRVKVCKDGLPERHITKTAWHDVAKGNTTNLKLAHVEDLVDKQSDAIATETFSVEVEAEMTKLGYNSEAKFCRLVRQFYEAEDAPGISTQERCTRRLEFRDWLLDGVNFCVFPPYGSHVNGIPQIMFQGFLTNMDRRIQMFPYVKSGRYNVRSLGSLEIENFFGEFQDLDPKGSGVIKAEEIPSALEVACQLNYTRLMPNRPFHMTLSRAKVYPVNILETDNGMEVDDDRIGQPYLYPNAVVRIALRNHMFDTKARAKRKARRKLATIAGPDDAAKGVAGVRQHHKCDNSKLYMDTRLGVYIK